jgi:hypothetical protein
MTYLRKLYSSKKLDNIENDRFGITNDNFMFININKIAIDTCLDILLCHKKILLLGNAIQDILDTYSFDGITHLIIITESQIKSLAKLPTTLEFLQLGLLQLGQYQFNLINIANECNPFINLPCNLQHLELNLVNFNGSFCYLPNSIKNLSIHIDKFISESSECIMHLPSSIKKLNLSTGYWDCRYTFSTGEYKSIEFLYNFVEETINNFIKQLQIHLPISIKEVNLRFGMKQHVDPIDLNKIKNEYPKLKIYY